MALYKYSALALIVDPDRRTYSFSFNLRAIFSACDARVFQGVSVCGSVLASTLPTLTSSVFEVQSNGEFLSLKRYRMNDERRRITTGAEMTIPHSDAKIFHVQVKKQIDGNTGLLVYNGPHLILGGTIVRQFDILQLGCENAYADLACPTSRFSFEVSDVLCDCPMSFEIINTSDDNNRSACTDAFYRRVVFEDSGDLLDTVDDSNSERHVEVDLRAEESSRGDPRDVDVLSSGEPEKKSVLRNRNLMCLFLLVLLLAGATIYVYPNLSRFGVS
ncbi:p30 [Beet yellow stunt virus]|uniref:p30 n=1 Tax=Beet yellow stunt virus TaxID=35290 RepID=Q89502_9CLOS|nr:p30 [Beet yellow stunt virus]AAC55660.1 p30 [Beet yellow stunt virus]